MKRIPERIVREIRERVDMVALVGEYVRLEKRGARWIGLCPFHNEKTPSFGVNQERGFFYCFGCKKGGDAITFVKEVERCGYVEALELLAEKAGVRLEYEGDEDPAEAEAARARGSLYELYERLAGTFHHFLMADGRGERALAYARSRRLSDETIARFRLGYAPADRTWLYRFLRSKSYSEAFLAESGLFSKKYPEVTIFSDRLLFPIADLRGRVVAFGGRLLSGDGPKYINSPETALFKKHDTLFGLSVAAQDMRSKGEALLCEGYMDCIAFHVAGCANAVAPLGTAFTEGQAALIKRFAGTVVIGFDSDAAGRSATERAVQIALASGLAPRVLRLDGAKDASEILEKNGPERLKKNSVSTITSDDFMMDNAASMLREGDSGSRAEAFTYLFSYMASIPTDVGRDAFMETASSRLGADPASVRSDYARFLHKEPAIRTTAPEETALEPFRPGADSELIAALMAVPDLFEGARGDISAQDFDDEHHREAFIALEEGYRSGDMNLTSLTERLSDEGFRRFVMQRVADGTYALNTERFVYDGVLRIRERALERKKQRIVARIREYDSERDGDELSLNDLLYEKMYLDGQLTRIKEERNGRA